MPKRPQRSLHGEWSKRQVAADAGVGLKTVLNLVRTQLLPEKLHREDVILTRVAVELGANRPTNRENADARTRAAQARDKRVIEMARAALAAGLDRRTGLIVGGDIAKLIDEEFMFGLLRKENPSLTFIWIPLGVWAAELEELPVDKSDAEVTAA